MPSPFPGMDPYLENPRHWQTIHQRLITYVADDISVQLPPPYHVEMGERVYIQPPGHQIMPDVVALRPPAPMPSAGGRTTLAMNVADFRGEFAMGGSLAYRFNTPIPMALTAGYAFGGDRNHGTRLGLAGEF